MAQSWQMTTGGLKELRRDLRAISRDLPKAAIPTAGRKAAELVLPVAIRESPHRRGRLERSHRVVASQSRAAVRAGGVRAPHAHLPLFGTKARRHKSGKSTGVMPVNAWLFRALQLVGATRVRDVFEYEVRAVLHTHGFLS